MENMNAHFTLIIVFVIVVNLLSILTKLILRKNRYNISWFHSHFQDITNMWKLAKMTEEQSLRKKYYIIAIGFPLITIVVVALFVISIAIS